MNTNSAALRVALDYFQAWSSGDFETAMTYVSPDIVSVGPAGSIQGTEPFREFMEPFSRTVLHAEVIGAFGNDETALIMYDTATPAVPNAPGAECITIRDGKITGQRIIFDRLPFEAARRAAAAAAGAGGPNA
jgi:ketosteroid isomerase-like protein